MSFENGSQNETFCINEKRIRIGWKVYDQVITFWRNFRWRKPEIITETHHKYAAKCNPCILLIIKSLNHICIKNSANSLRINQLKCWISILWLAMNFVQNQHIIESFLPRQHKSKLKLYASYKHCCDGLKGSHFSTDKA